MRSPVHFSLQGVFAGKKEWIMWDLQTEASKIPMWLGQNSYHDMFCLSSELLAQRHEILQHRNSWSSEVERLLPATFRRKASRRLAQLPHIYIYIYIYIILYYLILSDIILYYTILYLYYTILCYIMLYYVILYIILLLSYLILSYLVLYYIILYYIILYYIILHI